MTERETYRHRNAKDSWVAKGSIHTFWVGQHVVRSWERQNFFDKIGELGTVVGLPETRVGGYLKVRLTTGRVVDWSPTECAPVLEMHKGNLRRIRSVAKDVAAMIAMLDENGFKKEDTK